MPGIDYSKWDNLEVSDDEQSQPQEAPFASSIDGATTTTSQSGMRVTRLEAPSTVTFGGVQQNEASVKPQQSTMKTIPGDQSKKLFAAEGPSATKPKDVPENTSTNVTIPNAWIEKGGSCHLKNTTLHWTQDRYSTTLRFSLPLREDSEAVKTSNKWNCEINGPVLSYADRNTAVSAERSRIQIWSTHKSSTSKEYLVNEEIPYPIHWEEGSDGEIDWTIERLPQSPNQSFFTLSLLKASPMTGLVLWWKKPLASCPEVTLDEQTKAPATDFQQAWKEAHEQFRRKMQSKADSSS